MDGALARFFYQEPDRAARIRMASSSLVFRLATGAAAALLLALFAAPLSEGLVGSASYRKLRAHRRGHPAVHAGGAVRQRRPARHLPAVEVHRPEPGPDPADRRAVAVAGAGRGHLGVAGVLYGRLGGDAASALVALVLVRHTLAPRFSGATLRRMLAYGAPLVPVAIAYGAITSVDRFVLQRACGLADVAVYGVAVKFFALVTMVVSAFQLAYGPFAFARANAPDAGRLYARVLAAYVAVAGLGGDAGRAVRPGGAGGGGAAGVRGGGRAGGVAGLRRRRAGRLLRRLGRHRARAAHAAAGLVGGRARRWWRWRANALLAPRLGPLGAGIATTLAYATSAVVTYALAQRVHPVPFRGARLALVFALALALTVAGQRLAPPGGAGVLVKGLVALAFAAATLALGLHRDRGAVAARRAAVPRGHPARGLRRGRSMCGIAGLWDPDGRADLGRLS